MKKTAKLIDDLLFIQWNGVKINEGNDTAEKPARRIGEADPEHRIGNIVCHDIQIDLTEQNKGTEHDDHRGSGIPCAAQRTGIYLVQAAKQIKRSKIS